MTSEPSVSDRDDSENRRDLLLHLGDMLESAACMTKGEKSNPTVGDALREDDSFQGFRILPLVDQTMYTAEYAKRVLSAFFLWPKLLLGPELNRLVLANLVRNDLFSDNDEGWCHYVDLMQCTVKWFGEGVSAGVQVHAAVPTMAYAVPSP